MINFDFIKKFQEYDVLAKLINLDCGRIVHLDEGNSVYENYILINKILNDRDLEDIENEFKKINKTPVIFFENNNLFSSNISFLKSKGYLHSWTDSFMFFNDSIIEQENSKKINKVETEAELGLFLDVFNKSYQKDDPQNPYGEVSDYLINSRERWVKYHSSNYLQYFLAYDNSDPVAVSSLTSKDRIGYISAVGSLKKVRGKGFGKLVTLYAVFISQKIGNKKHFLLTEEGTYPYEFYRRIGFIPEFSAIGMFK